MLQLLAPRPFISSSGLPSGFSRALPAAISTGGHAPATRYRGQRLFAVLILLLAGMTDAPAIKNPSLDLIRRRNELAHAGQDRNQAFCLGLIDARKELRLIPAPGFRRLTAEFQILHCL
jgi:hypothetical protein